MNVLITGGTGLIGRALTRSLLADNHKVWVLTRSPERAVLPLGVTALGWDGRSTEGWGGIVEEMDAVVNLAGFSLASWPWTEARKQTFWNSRVWAGQAVAAAIQQAKKRPRVLVQRPPASTTTARAARRLRNPHLPGLIFFRGLPSPGNSPASRLKNWACAAS